MNSFLRRATPLVLLVMAGLAWFGPMLPGYGSIRDALGDGAVLRFVVGVLCLYMVMLVAERQRMEAAFKDVLGAFRSFHLQRGTTETGAGPNVSGVAAAKAVAAEHDEQKKQAIRILVGALSSDEPEVRTNAAQNLERLTGQDPTRCAFCKDGTMRLASPVASCRVQPVPVLDSS